MSNYNISFAKHDNIPGIMDFIGRYWKPGHILGVNRALFEYEHCVSGERVNYALAVDSESRELLCICGFLQSCEDISKGCAWEVIWIKKPGAPRGIGVEVVEFIRNESGAGYDFFVGANPATIPLHTARGYFADKLRHYYRLNSKIERFNIANIECRQIPSCNTSTMVQLVALSAGDLLRSVAESVPEQKPYKDYWYILKRYVNHPVYKYSIWGIKHADGSINAALITRTVNTETGCVLRIIDYLGPHEEMSFIGPEIDRLILEGGCEYADIYCYGVKEEYLLQMGFVKRVEADSNIIPNYFEPFVRKNVDINFASSLKEGFCIFKGDADQDRPSII